MKGRACVTMAGLMLGVALLLVVGMIGVVLSGCNTMKGVGRDITGASEGVEEWVFGSDSAPPPRRR